MSNEKKPLPVPRPATNKARSDSPAKRTFRAGYVCIVFGVLSVIGGFLGMYGTPRFGADYYTESVKYAAQTVSVIAWLAAVVWFVGAAILFALARIIEALTREP